MMSREVSGPRRRRSSSLGRSAQDALLATDPEWLIGVARLLTAFMAVVAIFLDPTQPAMFAREAQVVLGIYLSFSMLLVMYPPHWPLNARAHIFIHLIDAGVLGWLAALTDELTSPFFAFLPFLLLAMTLRWGLAGAAMAAVVLQLELLVIGLPDLRDGNPELNLMIMRSVYFLIAAVMLGYLGAYRERSRRQLATLAIWPSTAPSFAKHAWLGDALQHAATVLGGAKLLVIWWNQDAEGGSAVLWAEHRIQVRQISDPTIWHSHDPETADQLGSPAGAGRDAALLDLFKQRQSADAAGGPSRQVFCGAGFSGLNYRGRLLVVDPDCRRDEAQVLIDIIAGRIGAELEKAGLLEEAADSIRAQERLRLARDLHDSVLQGLTAANLKLKALTDAAENGAQEPLRNIAAIVSAQQRRLRQFVEESENTGETAKVALYGLLEQAETLQRQWNCRIDIELHPSEAEVPSWLGHEVFQIVSEATANAVRHGSATILRVLLLRDPSTLTMKIIDNGRGLDPQDRTLPQSLSRRVADLGGLFTISRAAPGLGLEITLPCAVGG